MQSSEAADLELLASQLAELEELIKKLANINIEVRERVWKR